ncbi:MAG: dTDP-glucose 4,6-dehydratase [Gammaproteobacteria bacterium]|jgi:dTDP-glucose 4,6-dehydratase|nr:dTDP-glucose 4,6-dehydratase [Gammaproteobacteria bacterium]
MKQVFLPKKILVTGGAGFIGSCFIRHMLNTHPSLFIVNLDKLTYAGNQTNLNDFAKDKRYQFVQGDIVDKALVLSLLNQYEIDCIVHFAAESHVDRSISGPESFVITNVLGTFSLLEASREYWLNNKGWDENQCRFHHISTDEVYGTLSPIDPAFSEKTAYAPNSPYSASKAGSDHLVRAYFHTYGLPVTTSNCSNNYGPYQHTEKFIPTVIRSCVESKPIPVYGDGSNIRDWLYVYDHCEAIDLILREGKIGEVYNIGGDSELNNLELTKLICEQYDILFKPNQPSAGLINFVKDRPGHDWRYAINHEKITKDLSWKPKTHLQEGLLQTIKFYCARH